MVSALCQPTAAGTFYPAQAKQLLRAIHDFRDDARPRLLSEPLAIIVPHAGYVFSGQICADAFNQAAGEDYETIVILAAKHSAESWSRCALYRGDGFQTPLGSLAIDRFMAEALLEKAPACVYDNAPYRVEHSVEVVLPFVKVLFPNAKILPLLIGNEFQDSEDLGVKLAEILWGKRALLVASSDLSHYPNYADARAVDGDFSKAILKMDAKGVCSTRQRLLAEGIPELSTCACGEAALLTAISAAKMLGADAARLVSYANSGDGIFAERTRVVGYLAAVFGRGVLKEKTLCPSFPLFERYSPPSKEENEMEVPCEREKEQMLKLARATLTRYLTSQSVPLPRDHAPFLQNQYGVFVTLKKRGALRGCIGEITPTLPLCQLVGRVALQAALADGRFRPVSCEELADIEIEISLLTPPREVAGVEDIILGRDGVIIEKKGKKALFLPQVAPEQGWNKDTWLTELARKATLPPDAWRSGARLYTFQAVVFGEGKAHP